MRAELQIPTGPIHSFQALPYPLPDAAQKRLVALSAAIHDASPSLRKAASDKLSGYLVSLRECIGVEHVRREFLPSPMVS